MHEITVNQDRADRVHGPVAELFLCAQNVESWLGNKLAHEIHQTQLPQRRLLIAPLVWKRIRRELEVILDCRAFLLFVLSSRLQQVNVSSINMQRETPKSRTNSTLRGGMALREKGIGLDVSCTDLDQCEPLQFNDAVL